MGELSWRMSFLSLNLQADGWYQLEAALEDERLEVEPQYLQVTVEGPPVFTAQQQEEEEEVSLTCGQRRSLACLAGGRPRPETVWHQQTELANLAPVFVSNTAVLAENGSLLHVSHDLRERERTFVCVASNRKGSIERTVRVSSLACADSSASPSVFNVTSEPQQEHVVTVQGGVNLNCDLPPGKVLVQWEKLQEDGASLYITSWLAGFDHEYHRGCGDQYGIDTSGYGRLGCKVRSDAGNAPKCNFLGYNFFSCPRGSVFEQKMLRPSGAPQISRFLLDQL